MKKPSTLVKTPEEMKMFASELAKTAVPGDIFCLRGNLGAGKTTFAQGFINALLEKPEPVTSPTFNLVQVYKTGKFPVYHCDFYRLKTAEEYANLGLNDAFDSAVTLIEWPEIARDLLPGNTKNITIETLKDGSREVTIWQ